MRIETRFTFSVLLCPAASLLNICIVLPLYTEDLASVDHFLNFVLNLSELDSHNHTWFCTCNGLGIISQFCFCKKCDP